jgi:AcrR family transcriptional regulator
MSREPLSKELIVRTALRLLDQNGLDKLSMRRLGSELGVEAMSLYNHIRNKSALLDGIHEHLLGTMELPDPDLEWHQALEKVALGFRNILRDNPAAIPIFISRSAIAPGSVGVLDASLGILMKAGFSPTQALQVFQIVFAFVLGHAQFYYGPRQPDSFSDPEVYARFPNLACLGPMTEHSPEDEFKVALEILVDGLKKRV